MTSTADLRRLVAILAALEHRPESSIYLETWSPGDGWTRFRLYTEHGGPPQQSAYYDRKGIEAYLQGRIDSHRYAAERARREEGTRA